VSSTLLLDRTAWDLVLAADGNIAVASEPYALSQDAASAVKTWLGEVYFDTTVGIDWPSILAHSPQIGLTKQKIVDAALTVPDVGAAACFLSAFSDRVVEGQLQVTGTSGQTSAASFVVVNPQGST
jgi:hypothetical protein